MLFRSSGHVVVPLMGRFKNETGERNLVLVLTNETSGGLQIRKWVDRFSALLELEDKGLKTGPAVCSERGLVLSQACLNDELHSVMSIVQLISALIPSDLSVAEKFSIYRSFRRGATSRAKEQG